MHANDDGGQKGVESNEEKAVPTPTCPRCGAELSGLEARGPSYHVANPCGCRLTALTASELSRENADTAAVATDGGAVTIYYAAGHATTERGLHLDPDCRFLDESNVHEAALANAPAGKPCSGCTDAETVAELARDQRDPPVATDGGITSEDLTGFKWDILWRIAMLQHRPEESYGLAIKTALEADYGEEVNHGRLYPNLDELVDLGLVKKSELDKRTNKYELTEAGEALLEHRHCQIRQWLGVESNRIRSKVADGGQEDD